MPTRSIFALVFLCHWCASLGGRTRHVDRKVLAASGKLPPNIVFLHGGKALSTLEVISNGIPSSGEGQSKLGPGLYVSMYEHLRSIWTRDVRGEPWKDHVWMSKVASSHSEKMFPYVLFLQLSGAARFALTPRNLWYGNAATWHSDPSRQRCLNDFDVLFIAQPKNSADSIQDDTCQTTLRMSDDPLESQCEPVSAEALLQLWSAGCLHELKINPGRNSLLRVIRVAYNDRRALVEDSLLLDLKYPLKESPPVATVKSWLCPRLLAQQHKEASPLQKTFTSAEAFRACGHALFDWGRGQRRKRYGVSCDEANHVLDGAVDSVRLDLPEGDARFLRKRKTWWLKRDRHIIRKKKAAVLRDVACKNYNEAVKRVRHAGQTCADVPLETMQPKECKSSDRSIRFSTSLCWWL
eukprot:TRINITY_DN17845_c0_g2_i1.p1 TRINITY_DN17845_c0_g2~~TRINITY_DN17845_c0_g2_i1.p1  ORF type:complete len:429 (-),score=41.47 TRINITY_DN17845_c0_g2_i1:44-1270(-)